MKRVALLLLFYIFSSLQLWYELYLFYKLIYCLCWFSLYQKPITCQEPALQSWLWNCTKRQLTGMNLWLTGCVTTESRSIDRLNDCMEWAPLLCTSGLHVRARTPSLVFLCTTPSLSPSLLPVHHQTHKATLWLIQEASLPFSFRPFSLLSAVASILDW